MTSFKYFIFAGEPSGDLHGSKLITSLRQLNPSAEFIGVGGPKMRREGFKSILKMEDFEVMGFSAVLKALPKLIKQFFVVRDQIINLNPDCVVLIDYPGFNLRLAKSLRKKGFKGKIVHYICPSVWAHGKKRITVMANTLDLLLCIYPFELQCFNETNLKVEYVGNPLQERLSNYQYNIDTLSSYGLTEKIRNEKDVIALFPGSRVSEVKKNLPLQLEVAKHYIDINSNAVFAISCAKAQDFIKDYVNNSDIDKDKIFYISNQSTYELMKVCRSAIAKSGTVTLELGLHKIPTVVVYQLSKLNWMIAKYILNLDLPFYCIVNILANKEVFPEIIKKQDNPIEVFNKFVSIDTEGVQRQKCIAECNKISELLYESDTSLKAAKAIQNLF